MADLTDNTKKEPPVYEPTEDQKAKIRFVDENFERFRRIRRPSEQQWFVNGAMLRGNQNMEWSAAEQKLVTPPAPRHRQRLIVNKIGPKSRTRIAKFLKNRPTPVVLPATQDVEDKLDARATSKAFSFIARKDRLEQKYADVLRWAAMTGHGYWWPYWDPKAIGHIKIDDQLTGKAQVVEAPIGDVCIEVGNPFEILVEDPGISFIGDQPRIMRARSRSLSEVTARYPEYAAFVKADTDANDVLRYERQLAELTTSAIGGMGLQSSRETGTDEKPRNVLVKELFEKPCPDYPKGRYLVVANGVLLRDQDHLPYGFHDLANPYPCIDFVDMPQVGQYYVVTLVEQAIPIQREYNNLRSRLAEHTRLSVHPKVLVARQHQLAAGVWTSGSGEVVEYVAHPSIPEPKPWSPPPISADVWRSFELLDKEMSDIFHIYPESEGRQGQGESGYQTSLLQESADTVHGPDQRAHEMSMIEAFYKIRRLMKQGYGPNLPRLVSVTGNHLSGEAFEFSQEDIDENADIIVETGSALPQGKAERTQFLIELGAGGWLGNPADPNDRARFLNYLEMGSVEDAYDFDRRDEELARLENLAVEEKKFPIKSPDFFENHDLHQRLHADKLKAPGAKLWAPEQRSALIHHLLEHVKWINPMAALQLATMYGDMELAQQIQAEMMPQGPQGSQQPAPPGQPPAPAQPTGAPAPAVQQGNPPTGPPTDQPV